MSSLFRTEPYQERIPTHFISSSHNPSYVGSYAGVELPSFQFARTSSHVFELVKRGCLRTLQILYGETKTVKINSIEIVWEVNGKAAVAPPTLLKDDELVFIHLDSLFRRHGLGHLRVYYTKRTAQVSEKAVQGVDTSCNPLPYSEKSGGN
jgi:hypothetical protein